MTNDDEATQQRAERARKRKRREDDFESFVWKAFENVFAAAKLVYKTIEDILGKAEHMEQQIEALEAAMTQVEAEEGTVAAGVQTAVAAIGKLNEEIQGLEAGEPVEEAKIEALTTRAQALLSGLTQVANTLPSVKPERNTNCSELSDSPQCAGISQTPIQVPVAWLMKMTSCSAPRTMSSRVSRGCVRDEAH